MVEPDTNYLASVNNTDHGINFSIGFINALAFTPGVVLHHGYVELQIFKHEWAPVVKPDGSFSFDISQEFLPTRSCQQSDLTENFYPVEDSKQVLVETLI